MADLIQELLKLESGRGGRQVRINDIRVFQADDVSQVLNGHIGAEIDGLYTAGLKQVMHEQESQLVVLPFRQEEQNISIDTNAGVHGIDGDDEFLADQVGDQMFLCRIDVSGEPEDSDFFEEGEDDLQYGPLHSFGSDEAGQGFFDAFQIQIDHGLDQVVDDAFLLGLRVGEGIDLFADLVGRHPVDVRDLEAVFIKQGDIQEGFQLLVGIIADIGLRTLRLEKAVALLPDPDRVSLDPGQILQILDSKGVHA